MPLRQLALEAQPQRYSPDRQTGYPMGSRVQSLEMTHSTHTPRSVSQTGLLGVRLHCATPTQATQTPSELSQTLEPGQVGTPLAQSSTHWPVRGWQTWPGTQAAAPTQASQASAPGTQGARLATGPESGTESGTGALAGAPASEAGSGGAISTGSGLLEAGGTWIPASDSLRNSAISRG
jgi:hypothetical protein